ncbi:hypothetical protein J14TS2_48700 [Bacillus sp. J14TS2]|uniref:hypothetical protein n=1 Tax=Bacillus sp. J14TS2 TaxID=2807188 RepID=UPI001B1D6332|nr:hypothetical protein [Bacillus sp. J14TS2]GIN74395.1 hypothetical protein J14TS2_48700 [Bacillus sp. J14TS2]
MKRQVILIVMLLLLIGSTLFYQWKVYSLDDDNVAIPANQVINIQHAKGQFRIKQEIEDLPNQLFKLKIPDKLNDIQCDYGNNEICSLEDPYIEVKAEKIIFTYTIPAPKQKPKSFLLQDWLIQLEGVDVHSHIIQLSESNWREGSWVGNTRKAMRKEMDLLDYYYLEGIESDVTLFWQQKPLDSVEVHENTVLYATNASKIMEKINYEPFSGESLYLILTDQHKEISKDQLWIRQPKDNMKDLHQQVIMNDLIHTFSFKPEEEWLSEVLAAMIIDETPRNPKAKKMYTELNQYLSKQQFEKWTQTLRSFKQKQLKSEDLDMMLSDILNGEIRFFTRNTVKDKPFLTLIRDDPRKLVFNGEDRGEIIVLQQNDQWLIDAIPLLKSLNFQVQITDQHTIQADRGKIHYQFYPEKRFFDLNEQRYGIDKAPVQFYQEMIMMEIPFIPTLFNVEIETDANTIRIKEK